MKNLSWLKHFTISENTCIVNIYNVNFNHTAKKDQAKFPKP